MAFQPIMIAFCIINCLVSDMDCDFAASLGTDDAGAESGDRQCLVFAVRLALVETPGYRECKELTVLKGICRGLCVSSTGACKTYASAQHRYVESTVCVEKVLGDAGEPSWVWQQGIDGWSGAGLTGNSCRDDNTSPRLRILSQ